MTKELIDKHFTENMAYYQRVCRYYYRNYLAEDLLQEAYLKFINIPFENFISEDAAYLKHVGKKVIASIFQKRKVCKKHEDGNTSPLFEVNFGNLNIDSPKGSFGFVAWESEDYNKLNADTINEKEAAFICKDEALIQQKTEQERQINIVTSEIFKGLEAGDFNTEVFVMRQIESINAISKRAKMDRTYLTKAYNTKCEKLKQLIK